MKKHIAYLMDSWLIYAIPVGVFASKTNWAVLLPEEDDYIVLKVGVQKEDFLKKYCTTVDFGEYKIIVLKIGVCPFLNNQFRCDLEQLNCKVW